MSRTGQGEGDGRALKEEVNRRRRPDRRGGDRGTVGHRNRVGELKDGRGDRERGAFGPWVNGTPQWGGTGDRGMERSVQRDALAQGEKQWAAPKDRVSPSPQRGGGSAQSLPCCGLLHPNPSPRSSPGLCPHVPVTLCPVPCHPVPLPHTCPRAPCVLPALHVSLSLPHAHPCVPKPMLSPSTALGCCWQKDTEGGWGREGAVPMGGSASPGPSCPTGGTHQKPRQHPAVWRPTWWSRAGDRGDSQRGGTLGWALRRR